jgi:hypothetical protein
MKPLLILFTLLQFFCSCYDSKPKKEEKKIVTETEKMERLNNNIERQLSYDKEKIIMLSEIRKISFDTLNLILRDYLVITDTVSSSDENSKQLFQSAIAKISNRYKISKSRVATFLFSYKYEMITKEEIGESAVDDFRDNYEYEEEAPEPDDRY